MAEFLLVFGELLGVVIAHEAGDGGTGTGEDADDVADEPTADDRGGQPFLFLPGQANFVGELRDLGPLLDLGLHENEDLRHGEQADKGAGGVDAFGKERLAEHEALGTENGGKTDGRQQQAQRTGHEALDHGLAGNARDDSQAEQAQPEVFGGHELQRQLGQHGGKEVQGNAAEKTAPERAPAGGGQRFAGLALQGHLITLNGSGGGGGGAGSMDENCGNGAAEDSTAVNSAQNDQAGIGLHGKGQRQHQRHAHSGGQTRQTANDHADGNAESHHQQIYRSQGAEEAGTHHLQGFKHTRPP